MTRPPAGKIGHGTAFALIFSMPGFVSRIVPIALLACASPAMAANGAQVPEGSAAALFALGLLGVIVGRRGAMRPKDHDNNES